MAGKNMKTVSFTVPLEIVGKLTMVADAEYRSLSSYMRIVLAKHIEKIEGEHGEIIVEEDVKEKLKTKVKKEVKEKPEVEPEEVKPKLVSRLRKKRA